MDEDKGVEEDVTVRMDGHVAVLTFREGAHNHVSLDLLTRIVDTLEKLDWDDACRCTVLASAGRVFCAGAKLAPDAFDAESDPADDPFYAQAVRLFATRKPIVAAVQGAAVGAGLGIALAADFRVCSPDARFAANFVALGIHAGFGISAVLPRVVGDQNAALMLLTGRRVKAEEALAMGLADRLVEGDALLDEAVRLAAEIAVNAPLAVEETRATLRGDLAEIVRRQTLLELKKQRKLAATEDFAEGLDAVRERRPGDFKRK